MCKILQWFRSQDPKPDLRTQPAWYTTIIDFLPADLHISLHEIIEHQESTGNPHFMLAEYTWTSYNDQSTHMYNHTCHISSFSKTTQSTIWTRSVERFSSWNGYEEPYIICLHFYGITVYIHDICMLYWTIN